MEKHMGDVTTVFWRLTEAGSTVRCDKVHVGMLLCSPLPVAGWRRRDDASNGGFLAKQLG